MAYERRLAAEFVDVDIVREHLAKAVDQATESFRISTYEALDTVLRHGSSLHFDSPLEVLFWIWWMAMDGVSPLFADTVLVPQQEVTVGGRLFRLDFMVSPRVAELVGHDGWVPIAVELDGHAFHERTKEQVTLREQRDRALQQAGWKVFHFSYSEFVSRPLDCVCEVALFGRTNSRKAQRSLARSEDAGEPNA